MKSDNVMKCLNNVKKNIKRHLPQGTCVTKIINSISNVLSVNHKDKIRLKAIAKIKAS